MTLPKQSARYAPQMLEALDRAYSEGEFIIPTEKPQALALRFQGLRGALRAEGKADIIDALTFSVQKEPKALIIKLVEASDHAKEIERALKSTPQNSVVGENPIAAAEAALSRLLDGVKL